MIRCASLLLIAAAAAACSVTYPNRVVIGEHFPRVQGKSLRGKTLTLPDAFRGRKVIVLLGYSMKTQFDIDRWGIGFFTAKLDLPPVYELPTIPGLFPSLFRSSIDGGMRKGIPSESWKDVITVYGEGAKRLVKWTGTQNRRNARVLLLAEDGKVLWAHDRGYGIPPLKKLLQTLRLTRQKQVRSPGR